MSLNIFVELIVNKMKKSGAMTAAIEMKIELVYSQKVLASTHTNMAHEMKFNTYTNMSHKTRPFNNRWFGFNPSDAKSFRAHSSTRTFRLRASAILLKTISDFYMFLFVLGLEKFGLINKNKLKCLLFNALWFWVLCCSLMKSRKWGFLSTNYVYIQICSEHSMNLRSDW